jgi:hypothetical protein
VQTFAPERVVEPGARIHTLQDLMDSRYFSKNFIVIVDRNGIERFFEFNSAQEQVERRQGSRNVVVKAGQMGMTTKVLAKFFKDCMTIPHMRALITSHRDDLTKSLLYRIKTMHDRFPDQIMTSEGPINKPEMIKDSESVKRLEGLESTIQISTARAQDFGRGEPWRRYLATECAFYPYPKRTMKPVLDRVPIESGEAWIESTPNGEEDMEELNFYSIVQKARLGQNSFILHTLPWWLESSYKLPVGSDLSPEWTQGPIDNYTDDEVGLIHHVGWGEYEADERIRWRRFRQSEDDEDFLAEYFEDLDSCFASSAVTYYPVPELDRLAKTVSPPLERIDGEFFRDLHIWKRPESSNPNYVISVDPGQGKITSSVAGVWDMKSDGRTDLVALLSGLWAPSAFAPMVTEVGELYFNAQINSERNGHGQAFVDGLGDYENVYRQVELSTGVPTSVVGWASTGGTKIGGNGTKIFAMDRLSQELTLIDTIPDGRILTQMRQVKIDREMKVIVPKRDDFHDMAMIFAATKPSSVTLARAPVVGRSGLGRGRGRTGSATRGWGR